MKTPLRFAAASVMASLMFFAACTPPAGGGAATGGGAAGSPLRQAVNARVDTDGVFYAYIEGKGELAAYFEQIEELMQGVFKAVPAEAQRQLPVPLDQWQWTDAFATLGFNEIEALGFSSVRDGKQFVNKSYFHLPGGRKGLMNLLGNGSKPFTVAQMAPANTLIALEQDIHSQTLVDTVLEFAKALLGPEVGPQLTGMAQFGLQQPAGPGSPYTIAQLIEASSTRYYLTLGLSPEGLRIPDAPIDLPGIEFIFAADGLGKLVLESAPEGALTAAGDLSYVLLPNGLGAVAGMDAKSQRLYVASSLGLLQKTLSGAGPRLATDSAFQAATKGLPVEGTGFTYVSPGFYKAYSDIYGDILENTMESMPGGSANAEVMEKLVEAVQKYLAKYDQGVAAVASHGPEGILWTDRGYTSHRATTIAIAVAIPLIYVGLVSAMAVPAMQKIRENAANGTLENDGRAIGHAAQQYLGKNPTKNSVIFTVSPSTGQVRGPLSSFVTQLSKGVTQGSDNEIDITVDGGFSLRGPNGEEMFFTNEGKRLDY